MNRSSLKKKYGFENPFNPDPLSRKALKYLTTGGRLLDVGCGEGADSVFFAKNRLRVTSIDKNGDYLKRFRAFRKDRRLSSITIREHDAVNYRYPRNAYDAVVCLLVLCCMKRSQFEAMLPKIKQTVKPGGVVVMSSRNYLDPEYKDYIAVENEIEPSTFHYQKDCCRFIYFIEKNRLRDVFHDFDILYYFEGYKPCKYNEHPKHGDSIIICRRRR